MKVIIVTGEPFPNGMSATRRIECYGRAIMESGTDCEVLVYRRTEIHGKPARNISGHGSFNGLKFHYAGNTPQRGPTAVLRRISDRMDIHRAEKYIEKNLGKGDVLFMYMGPDIKSILRFMKAAKKRGAYCVRDLCELPYGTGSESLSDIKHRHEILNKQFSGLDGVICISESLEKLSGCYTNKACKHIKIPIMVDYDAFRLEDRSDESETPYIFHSGTLYEQKDGFLGMLKAFGKASKHIDKSVKFISTGEADQSPHADDIKRIINEYGIQDRVIFTAYLSDTELKEYLSKASLVISNKYETQQNHYCFSTKLAEYSAAGKPVILTDVGEAVHYFKDGISALIVPPGNTEALVEAIIRAFSNRSELMTIAANGRHLCEQAFNYKVWSSYLRDFLYSLGQ